MFENVAVELEMPLCPYPEKTVWKEGFGFLPEEGPRGGVERVLESFRPPAAE